jgi:O-Antigen ligase
MAHEARSGARLSGDGPSASPANVRTLIRSLASAALTLPPLLLLGLALFLAYRGGGIVAEQWTPAAVGTAVGLGVLAAVGSLPSVPRRSWSALGALAAFLAWCGLSMLWSASPEATLENVARLSLLLLAAVVGAAYAARAAAAKAVAVALAGVGAVLAMSVEVKALAGSRGAFSTTRLAWPIDYANGDAALILLGFPALLAAAAASRIRPLGRALVAAVAALALAEGLMTLSRGAALALVATLIVCVGLATDRARLALTIAAIGLPVVLLSPRLTAGRPGEVVADAVGRGRAAAYAAAGAALIVALLASAEHVWTRSFARRKGVAAAGVWACLFALGAGAFVVHYGRPDTWLSARWQEFRNPQLVQLSDAARFGTATTNRYDYWRVAEHTFRRHPFVGEGAGAFAVPWFRHRTINESVTDAHSWEAAALAETGLVGFVLLACALILPLAQVGRRRHELGAFASISLGGAGAYFVLHGSFDWLFPIAAVAVPALVGLGACAAAGEPAGVRLAPGRHRAAVAIAALVAAVAAAPVYLSTALTAKAEGQSATSTRRALNTLALANRVNPFAVQPLIVRSAILLESGSTAAAAESAREATERAPDLWTAWCALVRTDLDVPDRVGANAAFRRARELNPRIISQRTCRSP